MTSGFLKHHAPPWRRHRRTTSWICALVIVAFYYRLMGSSLSHVVCFIPHWSFVLCLCASCTPSQWFLQHRVIWVILSGRCFPVIVQISWQMLCRYSLPADAWLMLVSSLTDSLTPMSCVSPLPTPWGGCFVTMLDLLFRQSLCRCLFVHIFQLSWMLRQFLGSYVFFGDGW